MTRQRAATCAAVAFAALALACSTGGGDDDGQPAPTSPRPTPSHATIPAKPRSPAHTIAEGTWTVGEDVAPGIYKPTETVTNQCAYIVTRGNGDYGPAGVGPGLPKVGLRKGDRFESHDCGTWTRVG